MEKETGPNGVFTAVLTPFNEDLGPDHDALIDHCRGLLDRGCDGLAVLGTTGEANSLDLQGRLEKAGAGHEKLTALRLLVTSFPQIAALKEIMARRRGDTAWRTVRPPLVRLGPEAADLVRALEGENFVP